MPTENKPVKPATEAEELNAVLHWRDKHTQAIRERDALQLRLNAAEQRIDDFAGGECEWHREADSGIWNSGCGETWSFHEDGPEENGMNFCHSCGKSLVVASHEEEPDSHDDWRMNPCKQGHRDVGAAGGVDRQVVPFGGIVCPDSAAVGHGGSGGFAAQQSGQLGR